jgi:hypothetical protein
MKVEIRLNEKENLSEEQFADSSKDLDVHAPSCDVAIDIGQVLAANQALLKNMARKMEALENKIGSLQKAYSEQTLLLQRQNAKILMLEAPAKEVKAWEPSTEDLNQKYFTKFSLLDKVFRPWVMRRNNLNS